MLTRSRLLRLFACTVLTACWSGAFAAPAGCPDRFVKMMIPQPAGGVGDVVGRVIGEKVSAILGQPMVVENRPGATTTIGTAMVASAKPDGCTILSMTASGVVASVMRDKLPYNLERDLQPVAGVGSVPMALVVPASSKIQTIADFKAAAAQGLHFSSGGPGTLAHLSSLRLLKEVNGSGTHVPYKGNAYAIQGLLGGDVQFMFPSTAEALPLMQGNKVRILGVTSETRLPTLPNVPTMQELGFADFSPRIWYAFLVPARTPADTVARLHEAFAAAVADPGVQGRLKPLGFTPELRTPAETGAFMKAEAVRWRKVVKENNVTSED